MSIIPQGTYRAIANADSATFGETSNGKPFVYVRFAIVGGEYDGRTLGRRLFLTDAAMERTVESLEYAGCTFADDDITNLTGLGRHECEIVVEHEKSESNGKTYAEIRWVNAASGGGVKEEDRLDRGGLAALRDRARGTLVARRTAGGTTSRGSASDPNDIPF